MNTGIFQLIDLVFLKSRSKAVRVSRLLVHILPRQNATSHKLLSLLPLTLEDCPGLIYTPDDFGMRATRRPSHAG